MADQLTHAETLAIAGAIKPAQVEAAKNRLPDGFSEKVSLTIDLNGTVQKGIGKAAGSYNYKPAVSLSGFPTTCVLLRSLGVGNKRLIAALSALPSGIIEPDEEFAQLFAAEEAKRTKRTRSKIGTTAATRGAVTSTIQVEKRKP